MRSVRQNVEPPVPVLGCPNGFGSLRIPFLDRVALGRSPEHFLMRPLARNTSNRSFGLPGVVHLDLLTVLSVHIRLLVELDLVRRSELLLQVGSASHKSFAHSHLLFDLLVRVEVRFVTRLLDA